MFQVVEVQQKLEAKKKDIEKLQEKDKALQVTFQTSLGENNKFVDYLSKVFKKKIKRSKKKVTEGDGKWKLGNCFIVFNHSYIQSHVFTDSYIHTSLVAGSDEESDEDSDDESDWSESEDESDSEGGGGGGGGYDLDVCPSGCDQNIYDNTCALREKRWAGDRRSFS
jgi:hypothetical protein